MADTGEEDRALRRFVLLVVVLFCLDSKEFIALCIFGFTLHVCTHVSFLCNIYRIPGGGQPSNITP